MSKYRDRFGRPTYYDDDDCMDAYYTYSAPYDEEGEEDMEPFVKITERRKVRNKDRTAAAAGAARFAATTFDAIYGFEYCCVRADGSCAWLHRKAALDAGCYQLVMAADAVAAKSRERQQYKERCEGGWRSGASYGTFYRRVRRDFENGRYYGQLYRNMRHWQGRYEWRTGQTYEGQWYDNKMHGHGTYRWPDGRRYTGQFVDDQMQGHGLFEYGDGSYFEGQFMYDHIDGEGVYHKDTGEEITVVWNEVHPLDAVFLANPAFAHAAHADVQAAMRAAAMKRRAEHPEDYVDPRAAANAVPSDLPPPSLLSDPGVEVECVICRDETKTRAVVPCGHLCVCDECAATGKVRLCPLCRVPVQELLKLYM